MDNVSQVHTLLQKIEKVLHQIISELKKQESSVLTVQELYTKKGLLIDELTDISLVETENIDENTRNEIATLYKKVTDLEDIALNQINESVDAISGHMQQNAKEIETSNAYNEQPGHSNSLFINSKLEG